MYKYLGLASRIRGKNLSFLNMSISFAAQHPKVIPYEIPLVPHYKQLCAMMCNAIITYYRCRCCECPLIGTSFERPTIRFVPPIQMNFCSRRNIKNVTRCPKSRSITIFDYWCKKNECLSHELRTVGVIARNRMAQNLIKKQYQPPLHLPIGIMKTQAYNSLTNGKFTTLTHEYMRLWRKRRRAIVSGIMKNGGGKLDRQEIVRVFH